MFMVCSTAESEASSTENRYPHSSVSATTKVWTFGLWDLETSKPGSTLCARNEAQFFVALDSFGVLWVAVSESLFGQWEQTSKYTWALN